MRKYLLFILLAIVFTSCSNDYIENGESLINKEKETNVEIASRIDTTQTYYLYVSDDNKLYAYNTETHLIDYKVIDESGVVKLIFICSVMCIFVIAIIFGLILNDYPLKQKTNDKRSFK